MADKRTALFPVHQKLGAKLIPFGGWTMPVEYAGIAKEHAAVRTAAGLFDVSHGVELYFPAVHSEKLWSGILDAGQSAGLLPAGLGVRNTLRLEAKLLLYGNDLDETTSLLEAGLGWVVKLDKGDFIGRDALGKQKKEGLRRKLVGFEMLGRDIARDHYPVHIDGKEVSHVTSGSPSITLKKNIGLAYLPVEHSENGSKLEVLVRGRACEAAVVPTPFYKRKHA